jgi:hypothetical protein
MNQKEFWDTISNALRRSSKGRHWTDRSQLVDVLSEFPRNELAEWERHFGRLLDQAYSGILWNALILLRSNFHYCGDDSFRDFRETLIVCGEEIYTSITANPDCLIDHPYLLEWGEDYFFRCARDAWGLQDPELDEELNQGQIVWERLIAPFPSFSDLETLYPCISKRVRDLEPEYWNELRQNRSA